MCKLFAFTLPFPPSVNHYYGQRGTIKFLTAKAKKFRGEVEKEVLLNNVDLKLEGPLKMEITLVPPDRRKRDIDNPVKPVLDALEHAGVYVNDSQIEELVVKKLPFAGKNEAHSKIKISRIHNDNNTSN